jgi:hypothetical protein
MPCWGHWLALLVSKEAKEKDWQHSLEQAEEPCPIEV